MTTLEPLNDFFVFRIVKAEVGPIVTPDTVEDRDRQRCVVIAVGPGRALEDGSRMEMSIQVGDEVIVAPPPGAAGETRITGERLITCREEYVVAKVKREGADANPDVPQRVLLFPG